MKNQSLNLKTDTQSKDHAKKYRSGRQSEPNSSYEELLHDIEKIKHKHELNKNPKRIPRFSELSQFETQTLSSTDLKLQQWKGSPPLYTAFSQTFNLEPTAMKKSPNKIYQGKLHSPQHPSKKINSPSQAKIKKSPTNKNNNSLKMIEEMLTSHGIKLTKNTEKKQKSPRFSEPLYPQNEILKFNSKKKNESLGSIRKSQQHSQFQLKQTMSTSTSHKNTHQLKISDFQVGKLLGKGKFGKVKLAKHKKTGMLFSIKIINKNQIKAENIINQVIREAKIQSYINHCHIIKLYSIFDDLQNIYLLLELCSDGNLYALMQKKIKFTEEQASQILRQVCDSVSELHECGIIHRDIKPQNIVMCNKMAKLCDFGWCTENKDFLRQTFCGTPLYVSPQILNGDSYDEKIDIWAIGVLGYELMTGSIPFRIKSQKDLMKIVEKQIVYPAWMSRLAISFLHILLQKNPRKRQSINSVLAHEFLQSSKNR